MGCTLAPPGEYDDWMCTGAAMRPVTTITVALGVFSCWPDGLELTPGFYPRSNEQNRLF